MLKISSLKFVFMVLLSIVLLPSFSYAYQLQCAATVADLRYPDQNTRSGHVEYKTSSTGSSFEEAFRNLLTCETCNIVKIRCVPIE